MCVRARMSTRTGIPRVGEAERGCSSRAGQKNHQGGQEDNMEKLEGPEHSEAFVRRWKLETGMIPKQKNLPKDPVL